MGGTWVWMASRVTAEPRSTVVLAVNVSYESRPFLPRAFLLLDQGVVAVPRRQGRRKEIHARPHDKLQRLLDVGPHEAGETDRDPGHRLGAWVLEAISPRGFGGDPQLVRENGPANGPLNPASV